MKRELSKSRHAGIYMIALLSVLLLVVPVQTVSATSGDYTYTVTSGQATITGYTGTGGDVVIPDTLGGYPVIAIGDRAFQYCYLVTSIDIPDGVTSIGDYAFQGCNSLARVEIPGSVTSIGVYVFYECHGWLTEINVDPSNSHYMSIAGNLFDKEGTILIQYAIAKEEATYTIPGTVTTIGPGAFQDCLYLTSVTIPNGVTSIGQSAFSGCISLTSVTLSSSLSSTGQWAFAACHSLTSITFLGLTPPTTGLGWILATPAELRGHAYYGSGFPVPGELFDPGEWYDQLLMGDYIAEYNYTIADGKATITKYIGERRDVPIPDTLGGCPVVAIGDYAFYNCTSLASVTIPDSVTSIGNYAFYNCTSLASVTIPNSVTSIGIGVFRECTSLTSVTIPDSVTSIGNYAFYNCTSLASVTIPNSVTSIGNYAFYNCTSLASVTIPNSVTSIGNYAFYNCTSLASVTIPDSVTSIGSGLFYNCTFLASVTIPDSVTSIGRETFQNCTSLTSVAIPSSVTSIGYGSFSGCTSLASVTIPNSVTSIGNYAFYNCTSLASVTIPNSVTSIGSGLFYNCTSLTSVTIPNSVTSIRDWTFAYCTALESIDIPDSITSIGYAAFYECSKLASIHFQGNQPFVGNNWIGGTPSNIRGHAFYSSNFPAPGNDFHGLLMGSYLANVTFSQTGIDPDNGGIVLTVNGATYGASELPVTFIWYSDTSVTVTAKANTEYKFINWTENGTVVGTKASYTFNVGESGRTLVANFLEAGEKAEKAEKPEKPGKP